MNALQYRKFLDKRKQELLDRYKLNDVNYTSVLWALIQRMKDQFCEEPREFDKNFKRIVQVKGNKKMKEFVLTFPYENVNFVKTILKFYIEEIGYNGYSPKTNIGEIKAGEEIKVGFFTIRKAYVEELEAKKRGEEIDYEDSLMSFLHEILIFGLLVELISREEYCNVKFIFRPKNVVKKI